MKIYCVNFIYNECKNLKYVDIFDWGDFVWLVVY